MQLQFGSSAVGLKGIKTLPFQRNNNHMNKTWLQPIFNYPSPEATARCCIGYVLSANVITSRGCFFFFRKL